MVIDLKVLVRSFNCESRACYVGSPRESFFQVCERNIFSRKFRESWISWLPNIGSAKDKHGVRESCAKVAFLFEKNGRSRTKEFWSTIIFIDIPLFMWHSFWHSIWHHLASSGIFSDTLIRIYSDILLAFILTKFGISSGFKSWKLRYSTMLCLDIQIILYVVYLIL